MRYDNLTVHGRKNLDDLVKAILAGKQSCMQEMGNCPHSDETVGFSLCRATTVVWLRDLRVMVDLSKSVAVCDAHIDFVAWKGTENERRIIREIMWPLEEHKALSA